MLVSLRCPCIISILFLIIDPTDKILSVFFVKILLSTTTGVVQMPCYSQLNCYPPVCMLWYDPYPLSFSKQPLTGYEWECINISITSKTFFLWSWKKTIAVNKFMIHDSYPRTIWKLISSIIFFSNTSKLKR